MKAKKHHRKRPEVRAITQLPNKRYFDGDINDRSAVKRYRHGDAIDMKTAVKTTSLAEDLDEVKKKYKDSLVRRGLIKEDEPEGGLL